MYLSLSDIFDFGTEKILENDKPENVIIGYSSVHYRIFPLLTRVVTLIRILLLLNLVRTLVHCVQP